MGRSKVRWIWGAKAGVVVALVFGGPAQPAHAAVVCPAVSDAYSAAVLADSPAAYYRLDEPGGPTLCDSSAAGQNGSYAGSGVSFGLAGIVTDDAAIGTTGSASGFGTGGPGLTGTGSFTFEAWFKSTGTTQNQALVDMGQGGSAGHIVGLTTWMQSCPVGSGGPSTLGLDEFAASNCWDTSDASVNLWDGQWHYLAITYDHASNQVTGYVDGQNLGSETPDSTFDVAASSIRLGYWSDTFVNQPLIGDADEIAVYPTALSAARILAHYQASGRGLPAPPGSPPPPPSPLGRIHGSITDAGHAGSPVAGALVQICPTGHLFTSACHLLTTDSQGAYAVGGLSPGSYDIEADPPGDALIRGSGTVTVAAGQDVAEDFALHAPLPIPPGVTITTVNGTFTAGQLPTLNWKLPFTVTYPLRLPNAYGNGTKLTVIVQDTVTGTGAGFGLEALTTAHLTKQSGSWVLTSEHAGPPTLADKAGCGATPPYPAFTPSSAPGAIDQNQVSQASPGGAVLDQETANTAGFLHGTSVLHHNQHMTIDPISCGSAGASRVKAHGAGGGGGGEPICPPGSPASGPFCDVDPEPPPDDSDIDTPHDPSGNVFTTRGAPVPGATVWLERSSTLKPPKFVRPPKGSPIMQPSLNPETTDSGGYFHWDVVAGYYRLQTSRRGCSAPRRHGKGAAKVLSRVFAVPPPRLGLKVRLSCPHLRRSSTRMRLRAIVQRKLAGRPLLLIASVSKHRRGRPTGLVTIRSGRRVVIELPLSTRTATARTLLLGSLARGRRSLVASYSGDGYFSPSRSRKIAPKR